MRVVVMMMFRLQAICVQIVRLQKQVLSVQWKICGNVSYRRCV